MMNESFSESFGLAIKIIASFWLWIFLMLLGFYFFSQQ